MSARHQLNRQPSKTTPNFGTIGGSDRTHLLGILAMVWEVPLHLVLFITSHDVNMSTMCLGSNQTC